MTDDIEERLDPEEVQDVPLEPLPPFAQEHDYLQSVSGLPIPTPAQIDDFVVFAAGAKSWYKHLPARPPGSPMHFYLDPNAGRDRLRRWGHRVMYRDRTEETEEFHYTWMPTREYRRRFGYLAFCCPDVTSLFMKVSLEDGTATLDPNVIAPLVEIESGMLALVPEAVLLIGGCMVTRTVHERTKAEFVWKKWNASRDLAIDAEPFCGHWVRIGELCEELGREVSGVSEYLSKRPYPLPPLSPDSYPADKEAVVKHVKALEDELNALIKQQRAKDHSDMKTTIENVLGFVQRSLGRMN